MPIERAPGGSSLVDVLDRVLDKGIVIDAWVRVSLVGIDLITVEARIVVASIDTYLRHADAVGASQTVSRPGLDGRSYNELMSKNVTRSSRIPARRAHRAARARKRATSRT